MMNTRKVCDQLNVTQKMLRVYEDQGLVTPHRLENAYRDYSIEDLFQIELIVRLRKLGFSIKEIKRILQNNKTKEDYINSFYIQLKAIENKINELQEVKQRLQNTVNEVINREELEDITKIIYRAAAPGKRENAYEEMVRQWDFDLMAIDYVERFLKEDDQYRAGIQNARELIQQEGKEKRILDVGCGTCNLWETMGDHYQVTALDSSLNMLMTAREKVPWAAFCLSDITKMKQESLGQFDLVVSTFTLHHIDKDGQEAALKNMTELCKASGKVVIVERCFRNHQERLQEEERLKEEGCDEELAILESEWYLYLDQVSDYAHYLKCRMEVSEVCGNVRRIILEKER